MESYTSITLLVPKAFTLPKSFQTATPEQLQHVLELADLLLETGLHYKDDSEKQKLRLQIQQLQSTTVESVRDEAVRIARSELRAEVSGKDALTKRLCWRMGVTSSQMSDICNNCTFSSMNTLVLDQLLTIHLVLNEGIVRYTLQVLHKIEYNKNYLCGLNHKKEEQDMHSKDEHCFHAHLGK
jgi:hypothetical protein